MLHTFCTYLQRHTFTKRLCLVVMGYTLVTSACLGTTEEDQGTTILRLVKQNNIEEVQKLLIRNPDLIKTKGRYDRNALHWACDQKSLPMTRLLIKYGVEVNAKDMFYETPLFYILLWLNDKDKLEALSLLANHHVDLNAQDYKGQTALHRVCLDQDILGTYCLLHHGINYHAKNCLGWTALHAACLYDNTSLITVVTSVPNLRTVLKITNIGGQTPMDIAKEKGHDNIVAFLDAQAALSDKHLVATAGLTRENSSRVIDAIVHLIVSYLLFKEIQK